MTGSTLLDRLPTSLDEVQTLAMKTLAHVIDYLEENWLTIVFTVVVLLVSTALYWSYGDRRSSTTMSDSTITSSIFTTPKLLTDNISIGSNWQRRRQTLAMFSCSLGFILPAVLICTGGSLYAVYWLFYHRYDPAGIVLCIYLLYGWFLDMAPTMGDRRAWMRNVSWLKDSWWNYACDYLPLLLVKTADLPTHDKEGKRMKYVLGYHPHGIIAVGAFCAFATDSSRVLDLSGDPKQLTDGNDKDEDTTSRAIQEARQELETTTALSDEKDDTSTTLTTTLTTTLGPDARGFSSLFPGLDRRVVTLPQNFYTPWLREYFLSMGAVTSDAETFRQYLAGRKPGALVVVVGGAAESMVAETGSLNLILEKRRGFVREAIMAQASLVPVLGFGETDLYQLYEADHTVLKIQKFIKGTLGFGMPLFRGRSMFLKEMGIMPKRTPVVVVVGKPIAPPTSLPGGKALAEFAPKVDRSNDTALNEDGKILLEWHKKYVQALNELYHQHKDATWNMPGKSRSKSLKILR